MTLLRTEVNRPKNALVAAGGLGSAGVVIWEGTSEAESPPTRHPADLAEIRV